MWLDRVACKISSLCSAKRANKHIYIVGMSTSSVTCNRCETMYHLPQSERRSADTPSTDGFKQTRAQHGDNGDESLRRIKSRELSLSL
jgi:hypothetical protein